MPPPAGRLAGDAVNVPVGGAVETVTVTVYWTIAPVDDVNVIVNVFVAGTATDSEPLNATAPMPWSIKAAVVFVDVHVSVTLPPPTGSVAADAVKVPDGMMIGCTTLPNALATTR